MLLSPDNYGWNEVHNNVDNTIDYQLVTSEPGLVNSNRSFWRHIATL